jgi:hypothetical protein
MVAVTNSLAFGTATAESDIDLFVVTAPGRLYTSRFFMKLFTQIFGVRAHGSKTAGRFCQSFFVTENALSLEGVALEFDPHLAKFVAEMKPIFGLEVYEKFIKANEPWVRPYLKHPIELHTENIRPHLFAGILRKIMELILRLSVCEAVFLRFMRHRDAQFKAKAVTTHGEKSIVETPDMFKMHINDTRREIAVKF